MEEIIVLVLGLADKVLESMNIKAKRKYLDLWYDNEEEIKKERAKWPNSNDPKLEMLYAKRGDVVKAAQAELQLAQANK